MSQKKWKSLAAGSALLAISAAAAWTIAPASSYAAGETRTISVVHVHTGERLTVTYMKNGRYVPAAMAQLNYVLRDWRRNKVITIDPRTIDLMWEMHADLGSKEPIRIICGYRSPETNGMLKRIGRHVATQSQHMLGKALDIQFPDVPLERLRNSAIVRQAGGVGYYPGGQGGFVHIDSASVRYWPRPTDMQLAQIFSTYRATIGARMTNGAMLAQAEIPASAAKVTTGKALLLASAATDEGEEDTAKSILAAMAGTPVTASADQPVPAPRRRPADLNLLAAADGAPAPRQRPAELRVASVSAQDLAIEPASAAPPGEATNFSKARDESLGPVPAATGLIEERTTTNTADKGAFDSTSLAALSAAAISTNSAGRTRPTLAAASDQSSIGAMLASFFSPPIGFVSFAETPASGPSLTPGLQVVPGNPDLRGMLAADSDSSDLAAEDDGSGVSATKSDLQLINDSARSDFEQQASALSNP